MSDIEALRAALEEEQRLRKEEQRRREEAEERATVADERATTEQRRREEEQRRREEEQRRREEEQRRREEEQRRREDGEVRTQNTTFPEFLHYCHNHLYLGLTIQSDSSQSTTGTPANADSKLRPNRIVPWHDFAAHQAHVWDILMESDLIDRRLFTSMHTLEETGEQLKRKQLGSELDLHIFADTVIDGPVTSLVDRVSRDAELCRRLGLHGSIHFDNHGNTLSPESPVDSTRRLVSHRRSPRLQARNELGLNSRSSSYGPRTTSRPRADQFAVYGITGTSGDVYRVPIYIMEFKAPHKLTLGHINAGLAPIDLDDIVHERLEEDLERRCQRLVAAVVTQLFSYMIQAGLEYGCVFTGVAMIFVRVPEDDCTTVEYALAVPHGDVGLETGWTVDLQQANRLHLTAVGQLLAFSLNATRSPLRSEQWRQSAENRLKRWEVLVEAVEDSILESEVPLSDYQPPASEWDSLLIQSPICRRLRPRRRRSIPENEERAWPRGRGDDDDEDDGDSGGDQSPYGRRADAKDTPSQSVVLDPPRTTRGSRRGEKHQSGSHRASQRRTSFEYDRPPGLGPYCTALCLQGLIGALPVDTTCPNFHLHPRATAPSTHHAMNAADFRRQMRRVLRERCHVEELFFHGYKGFLYRIRLPDSGYTVVAKGTRPEFVTDLRQEAKIYKQLKTVQGIHIPVCLGSFKVSSPFHYLGSVPIVHMLVLSFGGNSLNLFRISRQPVIMTDRRQRQALAGLEAIHAAGVLHGDIAARNILWNARTGQMLWHDFDRATVVQRPPLAERRTNTVNSQSLGTQKRKRTGESSIPGQFHNERTQARKLLKHHVEIGASHFDVLDRAASNEQCQPRTQHGVICT